MPTTEQKILDEVMATGIASRASFEEPMMEEVVESMSDAIFLLIEHRRRVSAEGQESGRDPVTRRESRDAFCQVGAASFATLAAIDSYLAAGAFGTVDEIARRASAAVRTALDGGGRSTPVEHLTVEEAREQCFLLLNTAFGIYTAGFRLGQARLEEGQHLLIDALVVAVLGVRLLEGE